MQVTAVKEGPLRIQIFPSPRLRWLPHVLEGAIDHTPWNDLMVLIGTTMMLGFGFAGEAGGINA